MKALAEIPVQAAEVFFNCEYELEAAYCKQLRAVADAAGMQILSVHPYTSGMEPMYFFSDYHRRFEEGVQKYRRYFEAAAILGAEVVVFHGNIKQGRMPYSEYFQRYAVLLKEAERFGVQLCHENVSRCIGHTPDFFSAMAQALPQAGFVLDIKQTLRSGYDPFAFANAMGKQVRHIHMSDHDATHDCLSPGRGIFNMQKFLWEVWQRGFRGGVIVELYRENFSSFVEISEGYQHLCSHISTVLKNR